MPRPLRILFVSPCWPLGQAFGGQIRAMHTARALAQVGELTVVVVGSEANNDRAALASSAVYDTRHPIPTPLRWNRGLLDRIRRALDLSYLNIHGCAASAFDRARVLSYLVAYDLVWVLNARTPNLLQIRHWPHAHLDLDDLPSLATLDPTATGDVARMRSRAVQSLLRRRERDFARRFTTLSVCSEADRAYLGWPQTHVIPNGFTPSTHPPPRALSPAQPRLGFIGLYSHEPNRDGVAWFLREAWPAIRAAVPGVRLRLVGRDTDGPLRPTDPDVDALGWLAEPGHEIATWSAMIVPIRRGGGTRIKIAEGFARDCPVVATPHGAYGYAVTDRNQLRLAAEGAAFAAACIQLLREPNTGRHLAARARYDFERQWTWQAITPKIWAAAEDCLRRAGSPKQLHVPAGVPAS